MCVNPPIPCQKCYWQCSSVGFISLYNTQTLFTLLSNEFLSVFLFTPGHKNTRLFITHGGQNSLLQAVYHAVPVLGIPLFGDQFDNMVRAESKGLGLTINPTHITRELLSSTIQTLIQDTRYGDGCLGNIYDASRVQRCL